jgi:hypothetical protein
LIFGAMGLAVSESPWWLGIILAVILFGGGIWFWRQLDKIPVESVVIGAANIRVKVTNGKEGQVPLSK